MSQSTHVAFNHIHYFPYVTVRMLAVHLKIIFIFREEQKHTCKNILLEKNAQSHTILQAVWEVQGHGFMSLIHWPRPKSATTGVLMDSSFSPSETVISSTHVNCFLMTNVLKPVLSPWSFGNLSMTLNRLKLEKTASILAPREFWKLGRIL